MDFEANYVLERELRKLDNEFLKEIQTSIGIQNLLKDDKKSKSIESFKIEKSVSSKNSTEETYAQSKKLNRNKTKLKIRINLNNNSS
jgi:hypothetical protein